MINRFWILQKCLELAESHRILSDVERFDLKSLAAYLDVWSVIKVLQSAPLSPCLNMTPGDIGDGRVKPVVVRHGSYADSNSGITDER
jgi:hypothetical protein